MVMNPRIPDSWSEEILWTTGLEWVQANKSKILRFGNRFLNFAAATNEDLLQTANILSFEVLMSLLKTGGLHLFVPVFFSRFRAHLTELSRGPESTTKCPWTKRQNATETRMPYPFSQVSPGRQTSRGQSQSRLFST